MVDENHQNMSKGGCKLSHHAIQIVKIVPCRPCPWKTGKLGRNNTCHKFVLAWKQWKSCTQTGTFSQHLGWVFIGPCHPSAHGPPVDELRKNALHWNEKTLRNKARHTHTGTRTRTHVTFDPLVTWDVDLGNAPRYRRVQYLPFNTPVQYLLNRRLPAYPPGTGGFDAYPCMYVCMCIYCYYYFYYYYYYYYYFIIIIISFIIIIIIYIYIYIYMYIHALSLAGFGCACVIFKLSNERHHFGSSWELTQKGIHYFVFQGLTLVQSGLSPRGNLG